MINQLKRGPTEQHEQSQAIKPNKLKVSVDEINAKHYTPKIIQVHWCMKCGGFHEHED